jgi:acylglycerol kinase
MKLLKTLRNHWKKSLFAFCTLSYGSYYLLNRKRTSELFQAYCSEALKHSFEKVHPEKKIQRVTVFLNPKANDESSKFNYDKNVAPLLNLSGLDVCLIRFDKNTEANEYMKQIDLTETDCIVIAGGNATVNEWLVFYLTLKGVFTVMPIANTLLTHNFRKICVGKYKEQ